MFRALARICSRMCDTHATAKSVCESIARRGQHAAVVVRKLRVRLFHFQQKNDRLRDVCLKSTRSRTDEAEVATRSDDGDDGDDDDNNAEMTVEVLMSPAHALAYSEHTVNVLCFYMHRHGRLRARSRQYLCTKTHSHLNTRDPCITHLRRISLQFMRATCDVAHSLHSFFSFATVLGCGVFFL